TGGPDRWWRSGISDVTPPSVGRIGSSRKGTAHLPHPTEGGCVYVPSRDLQEAGETARSLASRGQLLDRWAHSWPRPLQDVDRSRGTRARVPAQRSAGDHRSRGGPCEL